ncbi:carbonic anhydrase [Coniochaeta ligniaria NRRL 30616]|uniref:Carbonic anhydrase n=1 Tax=Coniochaeta ligniaria NRRL 30616 TaxID=1408157 RepID=A0A1J7JVA0_9PEZI|nr:carbonic anhydrase [Coniochaeta ligniaria NRRL 30616]
MKSLLLVASTASLASALCSHGTTLFPRDSPSPVSTFGYDGLSGPLGWYGLNPTRNAACALGRHQSPINIVTDNYPPYSPSLNFTFDDYENGAEIENLGTTLEVFVNGSMTIERPCRAPKSKPPTWNDGGACNKQYKLKQFHFHSPSEHHINGQVYPMEVHFVFQADDASLSVVGFPIEVGYNCNRTNTGPYRDFLTQIFLNVDDVAAPGSVGKTGPFNFYETGLKRILEESTIYRYSGSLTTPPCSEGVTWSVVATPMTIDANTYTKVKKIMGFNSRYTQNQPGEINLLDASREQLDEESD